MTTEAEAKRLGEEFVDAIKAGEQTLKGRLMLRDILLDGVIQHPIVAKTIREADYANRKDLRLP